MGARSAGRRVLVGVGAVVGLILLGNLVILGASWWARQTTSQLVVPTLPGVENLEAVDAKLWRGAAPTAEGYEALAAKGVKVVVDLRAEDSALADEEKVRSLGMKLVHIPVRDGQVPSSDQIQQFLDATKTDGLAFVHCGAGVGRTGTMAGAYLVENGHLNGRGAVRLNLAVGPPTLEQVTFVARLSGDSAPRTPALVTAVSRVLDAPRRIAHNLGF